MVKLELVWEGEGTRAAVGFCSLKQVLRLNCVLKPPVSFSTVRYHAIPAIGCLSSSFTACQPSGIREFRGHQSSRAWEQAPAAERLRDCKEPFQPTSLYHRSGNDGQ